jgi:hypothetical protein
MLRCHRPAVGQITVSASAIDADLELGRRGDAERGPLGGAEGGYRVRMDLGVGEMERSRQ